MAVSASSIATHPPPASGARQAGFFSRLLVVVAGSDPRRRIRLLQWLTAGGVYAAAIAMMATGIDSGWMRPGHVIAWGAFVVSGLLFAYVALRSGWSERLADPALTQWQIVMGVFAVSWGYLICGPMRTIALFPLLLIFAFGAFALPRGRIHLLALLAASALVGVTMAHRFDLAPSGDTPAVATLPVDMVNLGMALTLLAALAVVAARLSVLRSNLRAKREELSRALADVQRLATTDELTGLPNRRSMMERLEGMRREAMVGGPGFCVAVIDIDHFKQINDSLGHAQGDAVLWTFADQAQGAASAADVLGRWGGEEFLLIMPGACIERGQARVQHVLRVTRTLVAGGRPLTFSAGVARFEGSDDVSSVILRADQAMYAAKEQGRDRVLRG